MTPNPFFRVPHVGRLALPACLALVLTLNATLSSRVKAAPAPQDGDNKILALVLEADNAPLAKAWAVLPRIEDLDMSEDRLLKGLEKAAEAAKSQAS
jgi:hypothetical protein